MSEKAFYELKPFTVFFCLLFCLGGCVCLYAQSDKAEMLKKKFNEFKSKKGSLGSKVSPSVVSELREKPKSRIITSAQVLSEADTRHCKAYMKMANKSFAAKNYGKAISDLEKVFTRCPSHAGARFMRAVIAARMKDYAAAWHNAEIAGVQEPDNPKIQSLISKLETVVSMADKSKGVPLVCRALPISICEKACDVLERFLSEPCSANVVEITVSDIKKEGAVFKCPVMLKASSGFALAEVISAFKGACGGEVKAKAPQTASGTETLELEFGLSELPALNTGAKSAYNLSEYVSAEAEDADLVINDSSEDAAKNGRLTVLYNLTTRSFRSLNTFLRRLSPYALEYKIKSLTLDWAGQSTIVWQCTAEVSFVAPVER